MTHYKYIIENSCSVAARLGINNKFLFCIADKNANNSDKNPRSYRMKFSHESQCMEL